MTKYIIIILAFISILSCKSNDSNKGNSEVEAIEELIRTWSSLDPNLIGGPYELKGLVRIDSIIVGEKEYGMVGMCKVANLYFLKENGEQTKAEYIINKYKNDWEIWAIDGHNCSPFISLEIMKMRKKLNHKL